MTPCLFMKRLALSNNKFIWCRISGHKCDIAFAVPLSGLVCTCCSVYVNFPVTRGGSLRPLLVVQINWKKNSPERARKRSKQILIELRERASSVSWMEWRKKAKHSLSFSCYLRNMILLLSVNEGRRLQKRVNDMAPSSFADFS